MKSQAVKILGKNHTNSRAPSSTARRTHWRPALILTLAAPMFAELLSSSAPPGVFFIPWVFALFVLLYGFGALLIRELVTGWGQGWPSALLLGAAFGILEEGIAAKTFFDPHWHALGLLGSHGRWLGVNWVWAVDLILFHAVFSVALPILLVNLLAPKLQNEPWIGRGAFAVAGILFSLDLLLFFRKGNAYQAPPSYYWLSLAVVALLSLLARYFPKRLLRARPGREVSANRYTALGFSVTGVWVFLVYGLPANQPRPLVTLALVCALAFCAAWFVMRWSGNGSDWSPRQQFGLLSGALGFFAALAPFQEFNPARSDGARGMALVGLGTFIFLFLVRRHVVRTDLIRMGQPPRGGK
jgi:hypothetical protein